MRFHTPILLVALASLSVAAPLEQRSTVMEPSMAEIGESPSSMARPTAESSEPIPNQGPKHVARKLSAIQVRLLGGGLWLAAETGGFTLNLLRFKKNYGRDVFSDAMGEQLHARDAYETAGKALFGLATLMGAVTLPVAYSNSLLLPYPAHPTTKREHQSIPLRDEDFRLSLPTTRFSKDDQTLSSRSKLDAATQALGLGAVGISLLGLPLNWAMYEHMSPQHLTPHFIPGVW
ncbi:hypothetical protein CF319_g1458 [Tilletia indica]|uniref:Uncharacterized protein n=1 Tax=Tilletia indica TaxID=43049 RepID=A0A177TY66_9BASI|nr:hypothetical protein CF319_g1458 [Tilletia indica]KAE8234809.1 hypothetical protein CF326_g155 [Tilletia indica]KAE8246666.1 hypothetical protein A4X13_0g5685 [Tilletia indica]